MDVRAYGATGDGTTDDTAAIQAALDAMTAVSKLLFPQPPAHYKLTSKLILPNTTAWEICGAGTGGAEIRQYTSDTAIFEFANELVHSWVISGLHLTWNIQQTSVETSSYGIGFSPTAGGSGIFNGTIERLKVSKGYRAIGINAASG